MKKVLRKIKAFKDWFVIREKKEGGEISIYEARKLLQKKEAIVLLDIRKREEITLEYIGGANFIPQEFLEEQVEILLPDKNVTVVVYCTDGVGSLEASKMLREKGYSHVFSMAKGINGWKAAGYEVVRGFPMPRYLQAGQVAKRV